MGSGVDGLVVAGNADPRRTGGKPGVLARVPLHRGAAVVAAALGDNVQRLGLGLALLSQDPVVVAALDVAVLLDFREVRVRHAQLLTLINVRCAAHKVDGHRQHLGAFLPVGRVAAKAADRTGLVVVAPEQGIPAVVLLHSFLPGLEQLLQRHVVRRHQFPLLTILVIHLQVVEIEAHRQLVVALSGVADAVFQRGGGHLPHRDHAVDAARSDQLLQVLVDVATIGVEAAAVALVVVLIKFRLGDDVDDVETETLDALRLPEAQDVGHFLPHGGVLPVQVGLHDVVKMQIPFAKARHVFPRRAAEFRHPVRRVAVGRAVLEDVIVLVLFVARQCFFEPLMLGGGVVEHHVQHQADAAPVRLADKLLQILHRAVARVNGTVVGHIIAVVALGRGEERRQPEIVNAQVGEVVQFRGDALQIAEAVTVRVHEGFRVNLVDNFIFKIIHGTHLTKSSNAFLFADADGQHKGHNDGNGHAQRKAEHIGGLDGQNTRDAADADGVGRGGSSHTDNCCDGRSNHAADKREVEFQVDAEHSGLGNAEVAGDAGGYVDLLSVRVLALQIDHTEDGGALRNVGQCDHRPQHGAAKVSNQLHIDGVGHVMQAGDDQRGINKTEDCAKDHAEGAGNAGVDDVRNEGADLPADGAKDSVGDDDGQHQRAEGHNDHGNDRRADLAEEFF